VAALGLAFGWVRHRTHSTTATIPMHIAVDLALFIAAMALA
jgi:membrane protease YdiL (CAAX protease family)